MRLVFSVFVCLSIGSFASERLSSAPYLSGDTFRSFADYIYDDIGKFPRTTKIRNGDIIFVKPDELGDFFSSQHPRISARYILITHNSDDPAPGAYAKYLDDPRIIAWFAQNVEYPHHPKLIHIPIGLANRMWTHGSIEHLEAAMAKKGRNRDILLYMNFSIGNWSLERKPLFEYFINQPYCVSVPGRCFESYLDDLSHAKFVLSPRGNGIDCHRTWEAMYMGAVPIVKSSTLDPLFKDLPVLIVNDWMEINAEFLERKWEEMQKQNYKTEKLTAEYWCNLLQQLKHSQIKKL